MRSNEASAPPSTAVGGDVLLLQLSHLPNLVHLQARILRLPPVERQFADPQPSGLPQPQEQRSLRRIRKASCGSRCVTSSGRPESAPPPSAGLSGGPAAPTPPTHAAHEALQLICDDLLEYVTVQA